MCSYDGELFNLNFSVHVLFPLIETVTYTCHYMTDRLQRFDLKTSKLDLLKKKDTYILDALGVSWYISNFNFKVNYPFKKPLFTPFSSGCRGNCVCCYRAHTSAHATVRCGKNKTNILEKRPIFLFRPSRVPCLRAAGHSSLSNPLPRGPRPGRPSPECQSGLWG